MLSRSEDITKIPNTSPAIRIKAIARERIRV